MHDEWWAGAGLTATKLSLVAKDRWVGRVPETLWELFPRRRRSRVRLSVFDERTLELLSDTDWRDLLELVARTESGRLLRAEYGDGTLFERIRAWSKIARGKYVEARINPDPKVAAGGSTLRRHYRLTAAGVHLVRHGLEQLTDAPVMQSGGFRFYEDPKAVL